METASIGAPGYLTPVSLALFGDLQDVLLIKGLIEVHDQRPVKRRCQVVRYFCGEPSLSRLVQIEIETPQGKRLITPFGSTDTMDLDFEIPAGERLTARLIRGRHVDPAALPDPFPPKVFVSLELIG